MLTVVERARNPRTGIVMWLCRCDCGGSLLTMSNTLRIGQALSCGCKNKPNLVGRTFGKLTVLSRLPNPVGDKHWLCVCECGKTRRCDARKLNDGRVTSCGCDTAEKRERAADSLRKESTMWRGIWNTYKCSARERSLAFDLTDIQVRAICSMACHYCGKPPLQKWKRAHTDRVIGRYNGIDRVDNEIGYVPANVVPCCGHCNRIKNTLILESFLGVIKSIYEHSDLSTWTTGCASDLPRRLQRRALSEDACEIARQAGCDLEIRSA